MFAKSGRMSDKTKSALRYFLCFLLTAALLSGCGDIRPKGEDAADTLQEEDVGDGEGRIIYEGRYFDESWYDYVDMPAEESPLVYCEILISNVTDTSFDFVINEEVMATGETVPVVSAGTAAIEGGGKAVYRGGNMTLTFTFPDDRNTFPQHLQVSGAEKLENKIYINNSIPGHESG